MHMLHPQIHPSQLLPPFQHVHPPQLQQMQYPQQVQQVYPPQQGQQMHPQPLIHPSQTQLLQQVHPLQQMYPPQQVQQVQHQQPFYPNPSNQIPNEINQNYPYQSPQPIVQFPFSSAVQIVPVPPPQRTVFPNAREVTFQHILQFQLIQTICHSLPGIRFEPSRSAIIFQGASDGFQNVEMHLSMLLVLGLRLCAGSLKSYTRELFRSNDFQFCGWTAQHLKLFSMSPKAKNLAADHLAHIGVFKFELKESELILATSVRWDENIAKKVLAVMGVGKEIGTFCIQTVWWLTLAEHEFLTKRSEGIASFQTEFAVQLEPVFMGFTVTTAEGTRTIQNEKSDVTQIRVTSWPMEVVDEQQNQLVRPVMVIGFNNPKFQDAREHFSKLVSTNSVMIRFRPSDSLGRIARLCRKDSFVQNEFRQFDCDIKAITSVEQQVELEISGNARRVDRVIQHILQKSHNTSQQTFSVKCSNPDEVAIILRTKFESQYANSKTDFDFRSEANCVRVSVISCDSANKSFDRTIQQFVDNLSIEKIELPPETVKVFFETVIREMTISEFCQQHNIYYCSMTNKLQLLKPERSGQKFTSVLKVPKQYFPLIEHLLPSDNTVQADDSDTTVYTVETSQTNADKILDCIFRELTEPVTLFLFGSKELAVEAKESLNKQLFPIVTSHWNRNWFKVEFMPEAELKQLIQLNHALIKKHLDPQFAIYNPKARYLIDAVDGQERNVSELLSDIVRRIKRGIVSTDLPLETLQSKARAQLVVVWSLPKLEKLEVSHQHPLAKASNWSSPQSKQASSPSKIQWQFRDGCQIGDPGESDSFRTATDWKDIDDTTSQWLEDCYQNWIKSDRTPTTIGQREAGPQKYRYSYHFRMDFLSQQNVTTNVKRRLRRVEAGNTVLQPKFTSPPPPAPSPTFPSPKPLPQSPPATVVEWAFRNDKTGDPGTRIGDKGELESFKAGKASWTPFASQVCQLIENSYQRWLLSPHNNPVATNNTYSVVFDHNCHYQVNNNTSAKRRLKRTETLVGTSGGVAQLGVTVQWRFRSGIDQNCYLGNGGEQQSFDAGLATWEKLSDVNEAVESAYQQWLIDPKKNTHYCKTNGNTYAYHFDHTTCWQENTSTHAKRRLLRQELPSPATVSNPNFASDPEPDFEMVPMSDDIPQDDEIPLVADDVPQDYEIPNTYGVAAFSPDVLQTFLKSIQ
eukprot:c10034_g1_i5.p1 GENE.c10034_g1_i5~~c10034_g1_i5.p1  ORF type:complete len:1254 (-),score=266.25 c10034_g1_i5:23-3607(-)